MNTLDDVDVKGRKVILRTDINLPVEDGHPNKTVRFDRYMETIQELSDRGAKTLVVAHQGRPERDDFISLEEHVEMVSEELGQDTVFINSFFGSELDEEFENLEKGEVALLENIRLLSEELESASSEQHSKDLFIENLAEKADLYVNDAFSVAHRAHASVMGFEPLLESIAGRVMQQELENCRKIREELEEPLLVLGGEKPSDIIGVIEELVEKTDKILLGGIPGELSLIIKGNNLGEKREWIEKNGLDEEKETLERLLDNHGDKIIVPVDVETGQSSKKPGKIGGEEMVWDIGRETASNYAEEIKNAETVLMKGPMGAFDQGHGNGTRKIVEAIAESEGFTVLGGGHTSSLVQRFGHSLDDFSHVSIAGGAFVRFMSGEELPGVKSLEKYS